MATTAKAYKGIAMEGPIAAWYANVAVTIAFWIRSINIADRT